MSDLPKPLTPADCDLRDFPFLPLDIQRLFNSEFHARANDAEWRAGLTLWLKSFHQVPAGSIPDDEVSLARLAELGRDVKTWRKVKDVALYGWIKCDDGRLYHPVVVEKVNEAWDGKRKQRGRTAKARLQAMLTRLSKTDDDFEFAHVESNVQTLLNELSQYLLLTEMESVKKSVTDSVAETKRKREGQGKGQGKGYSVPDGTGGEPPAKSADQLTKDELWAAGKSLLMQAGMPKDQCGSFVGKLVKDYGAEIVVEAVRSAVVERPADAASFLKAACMARKGEGGKTLIPWHATDAGVIAKGKELGIEAHPGETPIAFKSRVIAAVEQGGKAPVHRPAPIAPNPSAESKQDEPQADQSPEAKARRSQELRAALKKEPA